MPDRELTYIELKRWMAETGRGYKRAAEHFGVPEYKVRQLAAAGASFMRKPGPGRGGIDPIEASFSAGAAPSDDDDESPEGPSVGLGVLLDLPNLPEIDPTTATTEDYLAWRLRFATAIVQGAISAQSPKVAQSWEIIAQRTRKDLDQHREDLRRAAEAKGRGDMQDPASVAKRILKRVRELAVLAPEDFREVLTAGAKSLRLRLVPEDEDEPST